MDAIVTVVGTDTVGITAKISSALAEKGANIINISQITMDEYFTMMMKVDLRGMDCSGKELREYMNEVGDQVGVKVSVIHEDVLKVMHRI